MQIYRVGGFVRDKLLGLTPHDCDYVVVGSTPQEMLNLGFRQVGKYFPVFLHPKTNEEYALARTEKKSGLGHTSFEVDCSKHVTLEQDLSRRDLTINAIAQDRDGKLIDLFNGQKDLSAKILRHISSAFSDDPLRILRVARFAAKFNFAVAEETIQLMKDMSTTRELTTLSRERVINELDKALDANYSQLFFETLHDTNNLNLAFPSIAKIYNQFNSHIVNVLNSKEAKYQYLAILLAQNGLPESIKELSLDKKTLKLMYNSQLVHQLCANNELRDDEILQKLKQIDIFRHLELFTSITANYSKYLQIINHNTMLAHLQLLLKIVSEITNQSLEPLITQKLLPAQFAQAKDDLYLSIIHQIKEEQKS